MPTGFAATVALAHVQGALSPRRGTTDRPGILGRMLDSLRYVFAYVRGRMDADDRKRQLVEERNGARRLAEAAFAEIGQVVRGSEISAPELAGSLEAIARAESRLEAAISDLAVVEKFEASEDLRLDREQTTAEAEWKACDRAAGEVNKLLGQLDGERRDLDANFGKATGDTGPADSDGRTNEIAALNDRRAALDQKYGSLRERAAALRASTIAARAKLDQAVAAHRQASAAMAASRGSHARERTDAETQIRELTARMGRLAFQSRVAVPALSPAYARIGRLEETIAGNDRHIAAAEQMIGQYDTRKLAVGIGLLTGILGVLGTVLWAFLR